MSQPKTCDEITARIDRVLAEYDEGGLGRSMDGQGKPTRHPPDRLFEAFRQRFIGGSLSIDGQDVTPSVWQVAVERLRVTSAPNLVPAVYALPMPSDDDSTGSPW